MIFCRVFDKDDDGLLSVSELRKIMSSLGDKMTRKEIDLMVKEADVDQDGFINCQGESQSVLIRLPGDISEFCSLLCGPGKDTTQKRTHKKY